MSDLRSIAVATSGEDAALIVCTVNAHDSLVDALRAIAGYRPDMVGMNVWQMSRLARTVLGAAEARPRRLR